MADMHARFDDCLLDACLLAFACLACLANNDCSDTLGRGGGMPKRGRGRQKTRQSYLGIRLEKKIIITLASRSSPEGHDTPQDAEDRRLRQWESFGHEFQPDELQALTMSIVEMALSRVEGEEGLYLGGLWALRRSDALKERNITHVLSVVGFNPTSLKNFKDEPWNQYGSGFRHMTIDIDDVDDSNLLLELPRAVRFIDEGLGGGRSHDKTLGAKDPANPEAHAIESSMQDMALKDKPKGPGGVFVHCMAGKSRSAAVVVAYLLWRHPERFLPADSSSPDAASSGPSPPQGSRSRRETAEDAVQAALSFVRRSRPMADPNPGFVEQLSLWWEMGCPDDVEAHHVYQRWAYRREVEENLAVGMAPTRLRFEDEQQSRPGGDDAGLSLRCKKCRRTLATNPFIQAHSTPDSDDASRPPAAPCPHFFVEPLSWMRGELEKAQLNGRLLCPNSRCGAAVGRYDWKGFKCSCGTWVTPAFSLQRARVDDVARPAPGAAASGSRQGLAMRMGIRMPPGAAGNL